VAAGALADGTVAYYRRHHQAWSKIFGEKPLEEILPLDLMLFGVSWHRVQAVKRLFRWAVDSGIAATNPVASVKKPPAGERKRILNRGEQARALRSTNRPFREFLLAIRESMARPQEVRDLDWQDLRYTDAGVMYAVKSEFKGRRRRRDPSARRVIPMSLRLRRLIERRSRRLNRKCSGRIFRNTRGQPWTTNATRIAMAAARARAGLVDGGERVVCYTWRHTAATAATLKGLRDKILAELLGHTSTRTTARYQHVDAVELVDLYCSLA
jgi:integrase